MLSLQDCLEYVRLSEEEIDALVEHEHVPAIVAAELANFLMTTPQGVPTFERMIVEDIEEAERHGNWEHALQLKLVLRNFVETHPDRPALGAPETPREGVQ